jgi:LysR family transcriptional regulator, glycine cleavage system transcriptional activator
MSMKPMSSLPLSTLRTFVAAAARENLRDAASDLGVTPSAVSHQIRNLEDWIGAPVFERRVRQVCLTPLGRELYTQIARGFSTMAKGLKDAQATAKDTVLRVSALPLFTSVWLIPRLEKFEKHSGGITIAIDTNHALADFNDNTIDVAIRNVRQPGSNLMARKLLDLRAVPMCTPAIAKRIHCPEDLANVTLIHLSVGSSGWPEWLAAANCGHIKTRSLVLDTIPAALDAAASGRGVLLGLDPLVWDAPAARGLVVPFKSPPQSAGTYFLVHRRVDKTRHAVRAFADWITAEMKTDQRRLKIASRDGFLRGA